MVGPKVLAIMKRKTSPYLVPWDDLNEEIQEYDPPRAAAAAAAAPPARRRQRNPGGPGHGGISDRPVKGINIDAKVEVNDGT